jgi:23S rRNA (pseudouridine1915-N3)-methyltransferase
MNLTLAHIHPRPRAMLPFEPEVADYLKRASKWLLSQSRGFASESALDTFLETGRQRTVLVLCDQRGKSHSSEQFAEWIGKRRDEGVGQLVIGIGPADGWSTGMLGRAGLRLSLGAMTLPHALARLVLAEQIYRAATILGGHPYHLDHELRLPIRSAGRRRHRVAAWCCCCRRARRSVGQHRIRRVYRRAGRS